MTKQGLSSTGKACAQGMKGSSTADEFSFEVRNIEWPPDCSLPSSAELQLPSWLLGEHVHVGASDWMSVIADVLEIKFGRRPVSIGAPANPRNLAKLAREEGEF